MNKKMSVSLLAFTLLFVTACGIGFPAHRIEPSRPEPTPTLMPTPATAITTIPMEGIYTDFAEFKGDCSGAVSFWRQVTYQFTDEYELIIIPHGKFGIKVTDYRSGKGFGATHYFPGVEITTSEGDVIRLRNCGESIALFE